jgi:hypothetical protein
VHEAAPDSPQLLQVREDELGELGPAVGHRGMERVQSELREGFVIVEPIRNRALVRRLPMPRAERLARPRGCLDVRTGLSDLGLPVEPVARRELHHQNVVGTVVIDEPRHRLRCQPGVQPQGRCLGVGSFDLCVPVVVDA